jgi:uncharacterized protein
VAEDDLTPLVLVDEGLELLDEEECLQLAATRPVGRVAVSLDALPAVFPVNFRLDGRDVVFRTGPGTKLQAALRNAVVAFEVDDFDTDGRSGWSVMIIGRSSAGDGGGVDLPAPHPARTNHVRIAGDIITGRRLL